MTALSPYSFFSRTDVGRKRSKNQDAFFCLPDQHFFILADGMGGHQGGEIASSDAITEMVSWVSSAQKSLSLIQTSQNLEHQAPQVVTWLKEGIEKANQRLYQKAQTHPELQGMGTTLTLLFFHHRLLTIAQVGDSRCYYFRPSGLWQLTRDHSLAQEKFRAGLITREFLEKESARNIITRSVGYEKEVRPDFFHLELQPGDIFLVCSDGLSSIVPRSIIFAILHNTFLQASTLSLEEKGEQTVQRLVDEANQRGGYDNVTCLLIQWLPQQRKEEPT